MAFRRPQLAIFSPLPIFLFAYLFEEMSLHVLAELLRDPTAHAILLTIGMAILILPMIALSVWYHRNIKKTEGGRRLMGQQALTPPIVGSLSGFATGLSLGKAIEQGRYGDHARKMQHRVYWVTGLWFAALVIYFGLFIWADELNRPAQIPAL
ncbi:hypothetical protein [Hyphomicrobium sulfonivorans]|uniref:hypothetical protein n=1 Tax=Hyphomicrobium sulfonivorans TaxID=121290 RepID=UPI001570FF98|nr:hypothetical protein [Hyphomicrobium sulfonivorans]MBI1648920.1 hypothetical protein [Hyphomicrobium sulfonivorans]NSL70544.1 hypothetical protein [Hyphomicrobium sulfonivorans]